jgi:hypothetical protein
MAWQNFCRERLLLLLNQYGFVSKPTVLHRFSPCTLNTILPNPKSNPFNIRKYFVCPENYGVHFGHGITFCRKKTRVRWKKNRVPAEPYYSHPNPIFFLGLQFCLVLNRVHWTRIRLYEVVKFLITIQFRLFSWNYALIKHIEFSPIIKCFSWTEKFKLE